MPIQQFSFSEEVYNETLETVKQSFPQYVRELQGIADGSQVEFYKVGFRVVLKIEFLVHANIQSDGVIGLHRRKEKETKDVENISLEKSTNDEAVVGGSSVTSMKRKTWIFGRSALSYHC